MMTLVNYPHLCVESSPWQSGQDRQAMTQLVLSFFYLVSLYAFPAYVMNVDYTKKAEKLKGLFRIWKTMVPFLMILQPHSCHSYRGGGNCLLCQTLELSKILTLGFTTKNVKILFSPVQIFNFLRLTRSLSVFDCDNISNLNFNIIKRIHMFSIKEFFVIINFIHLSKI